MAKPDRARGLRPGAPESLRRCGRAALLVAALFVDLTGNAVSAPGADPILALGAAGWTLEYFGREVAILRASLTRQADSEPGDETGSVVLSCAGSQRRLTLSLPGGPAGTGARNAAGRAFGSLLIRAVPRSPGDPFVIAPAQPLRAGTFSVADEAGQGGERVLAFVRLMLDRPGRLDLLLHDRSEPVAFGSLTPFQVLVSWRADDAFAFRNFLASCTSGSPRR